MKRRRQVSSPAHLVTLNKAPITDWKSAYSAVLQSTVGIEPGGSRSKMYMGPYWDYRRYAVEGGGVCEGSKARDG